MVRECGGDESWPRRSRRRDHRRDRRRRRRHAPSAPATDGCSTARRARARRRDRRRDRGRRRRRRVRGAGVGAERARRCTRSTRRCRSRTFAFDDVEVSTPSRVAAGDARRDRSARWARRSRRWRCRRSRRAGAIFETTLEYAKVREQFGKPIGSFQALKHRFANMYLAVEKATCAGVLRGADDRRGRRAPRDRRASMAKAAASDCQRLLVTDGLQLHGGIGFTWENDLHFWLKRAKTTDFLFGNGAAHRALPRRDADGARRHEAAFRRLGRGVPRSSSASGWPRTARRPPTWRPSRRCRAATRRSGRATGPARCSTRAGSCPAGRPSAAGATPSRSRRSSTWRSCTRRASRARPTCRASASSRRRSSTTARPNRSSNTPCRSCAARRRRASA